MRGCLLSVAASCNLRFLAVPSLFGYKHAAEVDTFTYDRVLQYGSVGGSNSIFGSFFLLLSFYKEFGYFLCKY